MATRTASVSPRRHRPHSELAGALADGGRALRRSPAALALAAVGLALAAAATAAGWTIVLVYLGALIVALAVAIPLAGPPAGSRPRQERRQRR